MDKFGATASTASGLGIIAEPVTTKAAFSRRPWKKRGSTYVQVYQLLVERNELRSIGSATDVARVILAKRVKKSGSDNPAFVLPALEKGPTAPVRGPRTG